MQEMVSLRVATFAAAAASHIPSVRIRYRTLFTGYEHMGLSQDPIVVYFNVNSIGDMAITRHDCVVIFSKDGS